MGRALLWLAMVSLLFVARPIGAQAPPEGTDKERDAARAVAESALDRYADGDYAAALERFEAAERIVHAPPHLLYIARCLANLGRLVEAGNAYRKLRAEEPAADAPPAFHEAWAKGGEESAAVARRVAQLRIELRGPSRERVQVSIDGRTVRQDELDGKALDPGSHRVVAQAAGYRPVTRDVVLAEGARETVALSFEPAESAPPRDEPRETVSIGWPVAIIALGGAGLVVGGVTGGLALAKQNELEAACPDKLACPADNKTLEDEGRALGTASTVAFIAGGVVAGAGIVWLIVVMSSDEEPEKRAVVLPYSRDSFAGFTVRF